MTRKGLLVIDVQGKLARQVVGSEALIATIRKTVQACRILEIPVLWVEQNPASLGSTVPELANTIQDFAPIPKTTFDATANSSIESAIKKSGITSWVICGIEAHVCVYQTARGLLQRGYQVEVLTDAISSRSDRNIDIAVHRLTKEGAVPTGFEMFIFEQLNDSASPHFKQVLPLLK